MKKLLFIFLIPICLLGQQAPPPAPAPPTKSPAQDFGNTQNNIMGAQARSFGGGSIIKPNPVLTSADFSFLQNPTYESGWRYGTGLGYSRVSAGKGFGANVILTFDLSQQTYSTFYRNGDWYYHFNFGRMGLARNTGLSVTETNPGKSPDCQSNYENTRARPRSLHWQNPYPWQFAHPQAQT